MPKTAQITLAATLFTLCFTIATAAGLAAAEEAPRLLEVNKQTQKLEVRHSQIGYRSTLLFYTFPEQKSVLKLEIGNRDKTFPVTATVYLFAGDVTAKGLKKWLNNQHSDGLYPDVPEPASVLKIPAKVCAVTSHKASGVSKQPFGVYENFDVKFAVIDYAGDKHFKLQGFNGATKVHVKTR